MPIIRCYVSEDDMRELLMESQRSGRKVEELVEAAISEGCCAARRARPHAEPEEWNDELMQAKHRIPGVMFWRS